MHKVFGKPVPYIGEKNRKKLSDGKSKAAGDKLSHRLTLHDLNLDYCPKIPPKNEEITLRLIRNDECPQSLMWLLAARNIFSTELFNMDQNYITKTVFDLNHEVLIVLLEGCVIGAICFRVFYPKFTEVVFCAVGHKFMNSGIGSAMMQSFKSLMQVIGIENLFVYADNNAIVFFQRHGFSNESRIPDAEWKGKLKDYNGATLLSAYIHPLIDYVNTYNWKCRIYDFLEAQLGYELIHKNTVFPLKRIQGIQIPCRKSTNLLYSMKAAFQMIRKNPKSDLFLFPPDLPNYKKMIQHPMDFTIIEKKLWSIPSAYRTFSSFHDDINHIFTNCLKCNKEENVYTKAAKLLQQEVEEILNQYFSK